jgi:type II secretory pathway component PulF
MIGGRQTLLREEPRTAQPPQAPVAAAETEEPQWQHEPALLRLSVRERLALLGQLSVMLDSGIQIPAALRSMREQSDQPRVAAVLAYLEEAVRNGQALSVAIGAMPRAFPELVAQMVAAGETAGQLTEMIQRVSEMLEADEELRGRVRSALLYPTVMLVVALSVVVFLLTAIVPKFSGLFRGKEAALPAPTRVLMAIGDFFALHAIWLLPSVVVLVGASIFFLRSSRGRPYLDRMLLGLPVIGSIYRTAILSRTSRTLGMLTGSGVVILTALEHTRQVAGSPAFSGLWDQVHQQVANGGTVSEAIRQSPLLPSTYKQMLGAGEASARLDAVLLRIATHYADDLQRKVRDISTLIEPILVVLLGGVVGFIALSIMLPIFKLSRGI